MQFHKAQLSNGLTVLGEVNPRAYTTAVGFFVRTGSRDEEPGEWGLSHFLEHMVFKGSTRRNADQVNREFDAMGALNNAYTSKESTVFWAVVLPELVDRVTELLADILRPALRDEDFHTERQVILEEIRMYLDQPPFGADEECEELHFGGHPLAHRVLGTQQSIGSMTPEQMRSYFQRRYVAGNIVAVVAGRVDFDHWVKQLERWCGSWPSGEAPRSTPPAQRHFGFHVRCKPQATQQYVVQLAPAPGCEHPLRWAAELTSIILGDSVGSRLYWALVEPGLAEHCSLHYVDYQGEGVFWTTMSCAPEKVEQNLDILEQVYAQAMAQAVLEEELQRAKVKTKARLVLAAERPRQRLFAVGGNWLALRRYESLQDELQKVDEVSVQQVVQVLEQFRLDQNTCVTVGPRQQVRGTQATEPTTAT